MLVMTADSTFETKPVTELKQIYRSQLNVIRNRDNDLSDRKYAFDTVKILYGHILRIEPDCGIESPDTINTRYMDNLPVPKVDWNCGFEYDKELLHLEAIRMLAYHWVKKNHPLESDQTDKFGQIVNARMNLIVLSRQG